jgi:hypothetical protein
MMNHENLQNANPNLEAQVERTMSNLKAKLQRMDRLMLCIQIDQILG